MALSWPKIGFRREASILLPAALLGLIALSTFTLFSYRAGILRLVEEERARVADTAATVASRLGSGVPSEAALSRLLVGFDGLSVLDDGGLPLVEVGLGAPAVRLPLESAPVGVGPLETTGTVIGLSRLAPATLDGGYVRVDRRAPVLLAQTRSLPFLVALVLTVNVGLLLLVILYLRHLLRPIDVLLDRAKTLQGGDEGTGQDDVEMLLDTFERAVSALGERQSAEAAPFEADVEALQRTLATGLESGLLVVDAQGRLLSINPAGRELLRLGATVEAGTPLDELLPADHALRTTLEEVVGTGQGVQRRECEIAEGDEQRTLGLTVHALRRDDGAVRGWLGLFADLTEIRKRSEEERLSESLEQIGALTAGLAHELRNGLASLRGYLTLIERNASGNLQQDDLREDLAELRHEADHLQRVIEDFLSFARPGSVRIEPVDLERLVHRAASDPVLARVPIHVRREQEVPQIQGDPQLLERALRNLLHNAARAQSQGARAQRPLRVRLVRGETDIEIQIEDDGPGIAEEVRERLFHPFSSGQADGVGLGLALSRRIAELHGGTIRLENRRQAPGALAVLSFPPDRFVTESNIPRPSVTESEPG